MMRVRWGTLPLVGILLHSEPWSYQRFLSLGPPVPFFYGVWLILESSVIHFGIGWEFVRQAFIGFFASHLIITVLLDSQALPFIEKAYPDFLKWLIQYHIDTNHDYFMAKPAPWFKAFIWLELLFQVPFFAYATAGFLARRNSVRIPCVIYGTSAATTVVGIVGDILASDEVTDPQRLRLICVYMPWLVIPSALVLMMAADPTPFGPGGSQPSASKQK